MAINLSSIVRNDPTQSPPRFLVYAAEGMGKSTMGALAPAPIFIRTEDGEGVLDIDMFPLATSFSDVMQALASLIEEDHHFRTLVVDTADHLEPMIWQEVCDRHNVKSIEDLGYGKGYVYAMDVWREYNEALNELRNRKKMIIIQLAHAAAKKFQSPESETYDKFDIKLHKDSSAYLKETSDVVFFINNKIQVKEEKLGFHKDNVRKRAVGGDVRYLYSDQRPASNSKNRYALPPEILFDIEGDYWNVIAEHIPFLSQNDFSQPATNNETKE